MRGWMDQLIGLFEQARSSLRSLESSHSNQAAAAHHFIQDSKNIGNVVLTP
jgi:hypothetical protein